jgi:hypothetical protein
MINIIISILLGIVLGYILYKSFFHKPIVRGPNSRDIIDKVFVVDDKYYYLEPVICASILK